jgi:hypothetical protein
MTCHSEVLMSSTESKWLHRPHTLWLWCTETKTRPLHSHVQTQRLSWVLTEHSPKWPLWVAALSINGKIMGKMESFLSPPLPWSPWATGQNTQVRQGLLQHPADQPEKQPAMMWTLTLLSSYLETAGCDCKAGFTSAACHQTAQQLSPRATSASELSFKTPLGSFLFPQWTPAFRLFLRKAEATPTCACVPDWVLFPDKNQVTADLCPFFCLTLQQLYPPSVFLAFR